MDKYKKLFSNTLIFAIGTFSSKVLSFLLMPFVTRMMGTDDYGAADLVQQTVNVLIPIVTLQVNSAALRFALDKAADKRDVLTVGVRTTVIGVGVLVLLSYPISLITINDFYLGDYIILILTFVFVSSFRQLCQQFVRGSGHVKLFAIDGIIATATTLLFTILFLGPLKWGVTGYIVAIIASDFCSVIFFIITAKLYRYVKIKNVTNGITSQMLKYCTPLIPTVILWWITNVSDRYMVTYYFGSSANGLYTAASKIPNFVILFSQIFIDAWQLSAVEEHNSREERNKFFTNVFRVYSGGVFAVASALILSCQLITKILVSPVFYDSWNYVPILIIATTYSCIVNFLASVYMAEKKSVGALLTASSGAITNILLNFLFIPRLGANGAALATVCSFLVVFVTRGTNTRKYIKIDFKLPLMIGETLILAAQSGLMLYFKQGIILYVLEAILFALMIFLNRKPIMELVNLVFGRFLGRRNSK